MTKLGIMGAMPAEIEILVERMHSHTTCTIAGTKFYEGILFGQSAVLCCAGMGKANAASVCQLLATHFGATAILFSGIAGNMSKEIGVGDVVISKSCIYHDAHNRMIAESYPNMQEYFANDKLVAAAQNACEKLGIKYIISRIATGDDFVGDSETKNKIAAKCDPACVEMEGAAVAQIACKNDLPFVIIRSMSDNADEAAKEALDGKEFDISEYVKSAADICSEIVKSL